MAGRRKDFGQRTAVGLAKETADVENDNNGELIATSSDVESDWKQDLPSIVLLLVLYTLQGIPIALSGSIPFLLQEKVTLRTTQLLCTPHSRLQGTPNPVVQYGEDAECNLRNSHQHYGGTLEKSCQLYHTLLLYVPLGSEV